MSDYIPEDLWPQILKNSPPETLIRCRCVCKSWKTLISSPSFLSSHLSSQSPHLLARDSQQNSHENYFLLNPQSLPCFNSQFQSDPHPNLHIIGTYNGLLCLADEFLGATNTIFLWNPLIRKCLSPPTPTHSSPTIGYDSTLGFGFDPSKNDLKIVRIARYKGGLFGRRSRSPTTTVEVFSVAEWKWTLIDHHNSLQDLYTYPNRWSQCLLNGVAHWPAYLRSTRNVILSFNFHTEGFKIIELPQELQRTGLSVSKVGDSLCVVDYKHELGAGGAHGCDVWVMKDYGEASSWCKMVSLRLEGGGLRCVLWVREDFGEMIVSTEDEEVLSCDPWKGDAKSIGFRCKGDGCFADGFVGSLVFHDLGHNS